MKSGKIGLMFALHSIIPILSLLLLSKVIVLIAHGMGAYAIVFSARGI